MKDYIFAPADILLPKGGYEKWSVIACDQFTSRPDYWEQVKDIAGNAPSTLNLIYPEVYLGKTDSAKMTDSINASMKKYLDEGVYDMYPSSFIYIERVQSDGKLRCGIVGAVDLDAYDYNEGSSSRVRATEKTVLERIPPRVEIRKNAPTELPHVLMLADDVKREIIEPLALLAKQGDMKKLYDFDLMLGGGHITGYLVPAKMNEEICERVEALGALHSGITLAVGDGNHSLATAKAVRELCKTDVNRYALCELVNIHSEALEFEPIYRTVENVDADALLAAFKEYLGASLTDKTVGTQRIIFAAGERRETLYIENPPHALPVGTVQLFLDSYLKSVSGAEIDYIHGEDEVLQIATKQNACGFIYDGMGKSELFDAVEKEGVLPRKTFSMGHARDKRYYIEVRKIK